MIVNMMELVSNKVKSFYNLIGRVYALPIFFLLTIFNSCNYDNRNQAKKIKLNYNKLNRTDSISINVKLEPWSVAAFNLVDFSLNNYGLVLKNNSKKDTLIVKKIPKIFQNQVIHYSSYAKKGNKLKLTNYYYLINDSIKSIDFEKSYGNLFLKNRDIFDVSSLFDDYGKEIQLKKKKDKTMKELDIIFQNNYKFSKTNNNLKSQLNYYLYINGIQKQSLSDSIVKSFIYNSKDPFIACSTLRNIYYRYIENRFDTINFTEFNSKNHSNSNINFIAMSVYNFLKLNKNRQNKNFKNAFNWLKETEFYKKNQFEIDKNIEFIDKNDFVTKLKKISLLDLNYNKTSMGEVIDKYNYDYYLIDFWATWCAPCISGFKKMKQLNFPKNVSLISLSVDNISKKEEWRIKARELNQNISYLIENNQQNKDFQKLIKLNSIPRYIIIDKNFNLINENFHKPHEPVFLKKLKELK